MKPHHSRPRPAWKGGEPATRSDSHFDGFGDLPTIRREARHTHVAELDHRSVSCSPAGAASRRGRRGCASLLVLSLLVAMALCDAGAQDAAPSDEVMRYHEMLRKRPLPGAIFERFYAEWLETGTLDTLRDFLSARSRAADATPADHLVLALLHARQGQDAAAIQAYDRALLLTPENAPAWLEKARLEARIQEFTAALASLDKAAAARPEASLAQEIEKTRSRYLLRTGQSEAALKVLQALMEANPSDEDLMEDIIALQTDEGLVDEAAKLLTALLARTKDAHQAVLRRLQLADLALRQSRRDDAVALFLEALERTGQDTWVEAEIMARLEMAYRREDDLDGLSKKLGELAAAQTQRITLAMAHARVLADLGNGAEAMRIFQDILARTPGRRDLREQFLDLLESLDKTREAIAQAEALIAQHAGDRELRIRLAALQHKAGDDAAAQASLEKFLAEKDTAEGDHLRVARLLEQWSLQDAARAAYARTVAAFPQSIGAKEAQAHFLRRIGEREAAVALWRSLAKEGSAEDVVRVGQALLSHGESREAKEALLERGKDFGDQTRYLAQLVQAALADKDPETALPHARARLRLSKDGNEIDAALRVTLLVIKDAKKDEETMAELKAIASPPVQERCLLAWLYENSQKIDDAEKTLADAPPQDALIALSQLSELWQGRKEWAKAALVVEKLLALPGGRTTAHVQKLVDMHRRGGAFDKALAVVPEWKKLSPGAVQPWVDEARLLTDAGRDAKALEVLRAASRKFDDSTEVVTALANACIQAGKAEEAEQAYLGLYEKSQDNAVRLRLLGPLAYAAQSRGALPRLLERFAERQKLNRASAQPWLALAEIHRATGNEDERRRCLFEASRLRPKDLELLTEIARSEEECGLWKQALNTLTAAAQLDKTTKTRERIARLHLDQGDEDTGYRMLYELAGGESMDVRSIEQMADAICENGSWERAVSFMEPFLAKYPKDYRLHYLHAVALEETSRQPQALSAFLRLMDFHEEISGVTNTGTPWQVMGRGNEMLNLPEGTQDWMLLPQMHGIAYQHRQKQAGRRQQYFYSAVINPASTAGPSLPMGFVTQPQNVSVLSPLALCHVISLSGDLNAEKQNGVITQLMRAGVRDANLLVALKMESWAAGSLEELLEKYPEHRALHAAWLMWNTGGAPREPERMQQAAAMFRAEHPGLALSAAVQAWQVEPSKSLPLLREILSDVARQETADSMTTQSALQLLYYQTAADQGESDDEAGRRLPEETKQQLARMLRRWNGTSTSMPAAQRYSMTQQIMQALARAGLWEDLIAMAEEEIRNPTLSPGSATAGHNIVFSGGPMYWSGGSGRLALTPLPFPAQSLALPPSLAFLAELQTRYNPYTGIPDSEEQREESKKKLKPWIEKVSHDGLRLVLQIITDDTEAVDTAVNRKLGAASATAADWTLAGWVAQRRGELKTAIERFAKAAALEQDGAVRGRVDNAILYHATQVLQGAPLSTKEDAPDGQEGIQGTMKLVLNRVAKTPLMTHEKQQVAQIMTGFGMEEEAAALERVAAVTPTGSTSPGLTTSNPYSHRFSSGRIMSNSNSIDRLMKAGNREAVVQEALKQIRFAAAQWLGMQGQGQSEMEQILQVLRNSKIQAADPFAPGNSPAAPTAPPAAQGLEAAVFEAAKPPSGATWKQLQEYAAIKELLKDKTEARRQYEAAIAQNPRVTESRVRLVSLVADSDVDAAVAHLEALPQGWVSQNYSLWQEMGRRSANDFPHRVAMIQVFTKWLNRQADTGKPLDLRITQMTGNYLQSIQQGEYDSNLRFPGLWQAVKPAEGGDRFAVPVVWQRSREDSEQAFTDGGKAAREKLRAAHDDYCRALLRFPETAQMGFRALAGVALSEKGDAMGIYQIAMDLLSSRADPKVRRRSATGAQFHPGYVEEGQIVMPSAEEVVVRHAAKTGGMALIEKDVLPLLTATSGARQTTTARAYARLLTCSEEEFLEAARQWSKETLNVRGQVSWTRGYNNYDDVRVVQEIINIWNERRFTVPLDGLMVEAVGKKIGPMTGSSLPNAWNIYLAALRRRDDSPAVARFLHAARGEVLGADAEQRRKDVAEWQAMQRNRSSRYGYSSYSARAIRDMRFSAWSQWLLDSVSGFEVLPCLKMAEEDGFTNAPEWLHQMSYRAMQSAPVTQGITRAMELAEQLGFLEEAEKLRTWDMSRDRPMTWLERFADHVRNDSAKKAVLDDLAKRPATLGVELLKALLQDNPRTEVPEAVKRRATDFARIPEARRAEMAIFLRSQYPGYPDAEVLGPALSEALAPILATEEVELHRRVDKLLAAKSWSDVGMAESQFTENTPHLISQVALKDREKATAVMKHGLELLRKSPAQAQSARQNQYDYSKSYLGNLGRAPELFGAVLELADAAGFTKDRRWCNQFASTLCERRNEHGAVRCFKSIFVGTPLVAEAGHFRDLRVRDEGSPSTLLTTVLERTRYYGDSNDTGREALRTILLAQPRTFGVELTAALANLQGVDFGLPPKGSPETTKGSLPLALAQFVERRAADFAKLDDRAAANLFEVLSSKSTTLRHGGRLSEQQGKALRPLSEAAARVDDADAAAWLATSKMSTLYREHYEASSAAAGLLSRMARRDFDAARKLFEHQCRLFEGVDRTRSPSQSRITDTALANFVQKMAEVPELFGPALARIDQFPLPKDDPWVFQFMQSTMYRVVDSTNLSRMVRLLEGAGLLEDAAGFNVSALRGLEPESGRSASSKTGKSDQKTDFLMMLRERIRTQRGLHEEAVKLLGARQPQTFGAGLMRAFLSSEGEGPVLEFAKLHSQDLASLPDSTRAELAAAFARRVSNIEALSEAVPSFEAMLKPLLEAKMAKATAETVKILQATSLQSLDPQVFADLRSRVQAQIFPVSSSSEESRATIALLGKLAGWMSADATKGREVYGHIVALARNADRSFPARGEPSGQPCFLIAWLAASCGELKLLPLALELAAEEKLADDFRWRTQVARAMLSTQGSEYSAGYAWACQQWLERLALLSNPPQFDPLAVSGKASSTSVFEILLPAAARVMTSNDREQLAASLRDPAKPRTFGGSLAAVCLQQGTDAALLAFAKEHQQTLSKLDDNRKAQVLAILRSARGTADPLSSSGMSTMYRASKQAQPEFSAEVAAALEPLLRVQEQAQQDAVKILKSGGNPDLARVSTEFFKSECCDELVRVFKRSPEEALAFYERVATVWEKLPPPPLNGFSTRDSARTELLTWIMVRAGDMPGLALAMRCAIADRSAELEFPVSAALNVLILAHRQSGGYVNPQVAWAEVMHELASHLGDVPPVLLGAVVFHHAFMGSGQGRGSAQHWASTCRRGDSAYPLAEACLMVEQLRRYSHTQDNYNASFKFRKPSPATLEPVWHYYTRLIQDEALPEEVRIIVAQQLCTHLPCYVPDDIYRTAARLAARSGSQGVSSSQPRMDPIFRGFATLNVDEDWRKTAAAYWSARDRTQVPTITTPICAMVALQGDDIARFKNLVTRHGSSAPFARSAFVLLAQKRLAENAAEELKRNWQRMLFHYSLMAPVLGPTIQAEIKNVVQSCQDPVLALMAEFILTDATTEISSEHADNYRNVSRHGQFVHLADRLAAVNDGDLKLRAGLAAALVKADAATAVKLAALLQEASAWIRHPSSQAKSEDKGWRDHVLAAHAAERWQAGDFATVRALFEYGLKHNDGYPKETFVRTFSNILCEMWENGLVKDSAAARNALRGISMPPEFPRTVFCLGALAWVLETWEKPSDGHEESLDLIKRAMSAGTVLRQPKREVEPRLLDWLVTVAVADNRPDSSRRRLEATLTLLGAVSKVTKGGVHMTGRELTRLGFLHREDLCAHAREFAEANPNHGFFADSLAGLAFDMGRDEEELAMVRLAITQGFPSASAVVPRRLREAAILIRFGKRAEAKKSLDAIPDTGMTAGQRRERKTLMKMTEE
jgi:tetratricopeptide (TPR) repeat protein